MTSRGFTYGHPQGWFLIGWSGELARGDVRPVRYFDRDLVVFRTDGGVAAVLDAHCPHLGAHLGYGGRVEGEAIVCPFHSWVWSSDGRLVDIKNSPEKGPQHLTTACWPLVELNGCLFLWYDEVGSGPTWMPPSVPEFTDDQYFPAYPLGTARDVLRLYPQFMLENMVDFMHLSAVHLWDQAEPKLDQIEARDVSFVANTSGVMQTPRGPAPMQAFNEAWGIGFVVTRLTGLRDATLITAATPTEGEYSEVSITLAVKKPDGHLGEEPDAFTVSMAEAQAEAILGSNPGDRDIWEHQIYVANPPYLRAERQGFRELRTWASRFYASKSAD